jgi:hypothetical protein
VALDAETDFRIFKGRIVAPSVRSVTRPDTGRGDSLAKIVIVAACGTVEMTERLFFSFGAATPFVSLMAASDLKLAQQTVHFAHLNQTDFKGLGINCQWVQD